MRAGDLRIEDMLHGQRIMDIYISRFIITLTLFDGSVHHYLPDQHLT